MTTIQSLVQARNARPWLGAVATSALLVAAGCSEGLVQRTSAQPVLTGAAAQPTAPTGTPIVVSCEPHQRTLVRPVVVNGAAVSQVECITDGAMVTSPASMPPAASAQGYASVADYRQAPLPAVTPVRYVSDLPDARVVPVAQPATVVRSVPAPQIAYREVKRPRTVKKSAIIIGSSAGAGAGLGAAIGGKKGALIGALVGGGGATVWDQITRR